jgi:hypothetical protein
VTLTIDLDPEVEERLREEAGKQGVEVDVYARRLIEGALPTAGPQHGVRWQTLTADEWIRELKAWAESHERDQPLLSDYAVSREGIYEGRY